MKTRRYGSNPVAVSMLLLVVAACGCNQDRTAGPDTGSPAVDGGSDGIQADIEEDVADTQRPHRDVADKDVADTAPDTDTEVDGPPELWPEFENRCAPKHPPIELKAFDKKLVSPPAQIEAKVAWRREAKRCPDGPEDLYVPGSASFSQFALSQASDGPTITVEQVYSWSWGIGVGSLGRISAESGKWLDCKPSSLVGMRFTQPLLVHPGLGDVPLIVANDPKEHVEPPESWELEAPKKWDLAWHSPGWSMPIRGRSGPEGGATESKLLPDGQLLVSGYGDHLVSIDSHTGELNWRIADSQADPLVDRLQTVAWRPESNDFVARAKVVRGGGFTDFEYVAIDRCGNVESISGRAFRRAHRIEFGDGYLLPLFRSRRQFEVLSKDGKVLARHGCPHLVSLSKDAVACLRGPKIRIIEWGQTEPTTVEVTLDPKGSMEISSYVSGVAFRDGILMVSAAISYLDENGNDTDKYGTLLYFIDWQKGQVVETFDVPNGSNLPPVVTDDGMIVFTPTEKVTTSVDADLMGIQTNLHGLSPTAFPRGLSYGRNRNLGVGFPRKPTP